MTSAPPRPSVLLGILFMIGSGLLFPVMNGFAKALGHTYPSVQVSWARAFGQVVFLLVALWPKSGPRLFLTRRPALQLARSSLLFASNICFFLALVFLPIGTAATISLTAPLVVALLAWPMLGERTDARKLAALAIGFTGVLIVIRPGTSVFNWASLLVVASASCYGTYQILTRRIAGTDAPETSTIYSSMVGAFVILLALPFFWKTPATWHDLLLFCAMGPLGAAGHYCVARAMTHAPANVVSPFQYFQLLGSVAVGYIAFDELPDALTWLGAAVIVASGLVIGWSQRRPA